MPRKLRECGDVLLNGEVAQGIFQMSVRAPQIASAALPGQFVELRVSSEPAIQFLSMPFAVYDVDLDEGTLDVCYQVVGEGTGQLSRLRAGDEVCLVGPIGNGWRIPDSCSRALLACGGVGTPALKLLADELASRSIPFDVVIGATTSSRLSCVDSFERSAGLVGGRVHIATDDGSAGVRGFVNSVTDALIESGDFDYVAVCGPALMERSVALPALEHGIACEVSMERLMACGIGACLGCVVETVNGLRRCCVDGPVFDASEVIW